MKVAAAKEQQDKLGEVRAYQELGRLYKLNYEPRQAFSQFKIAHTLLKDVPRDSKDPKLEATLLCDMGDLSHSFGDILEAEDYLQSALDIATAAKMIPLLARINFLLGLTSVAADLNIKAIHYFAANLKCMLRNHGNSYMATAVPTFTLSSPRAQNDVSTNSGGEIKTPSARSDDGWSEDEPQHKHADDLIFREELVSSDDLPWESIGRCCLEIGKLLTSSISEKQTALQYVKLVLSIFHKESDYGRAANALLSLLSRKDDDSNDLDRFIDSSDDSGGSSASESDWDDWDDAESTPGRGFGFSLGGEDPEDDDDEEERILPSQYKLFDDEQNIEITKYPKPTISYSLKTSGLETEDGVIKWLTEIITKHSLIHQEINTATTEELAEDFTESIARMDKFSERWASVYLDFTQTMYMGRTWEHAWSALTSFFNAYRQPPPSVSGGTSKAAREAPSAQSLSYVFQMLHLAAKMWEKERDRSFRTYISIITTLLPASVPLLALIQAETYCHHGANSLLIHPKNPQSTPLQVFADTFEGVQGQISLFIGNEELSETDFQALALTDIHLQLNLMSPLSTQQQKESQHESSDDSDWPDSAESSESDDTDSGMSGFDDSSGDELVLSAQTNNRSKSGRGRGSDEKKVNVFGQATRMSKLSALYPRIKHAFYKAKAAYAMGLYHEFNLGDRQTAERLYFESVYILDHYPPVIAGMAPIVSELGTNGLKRYGQVAIDNSKYTYGILAYHAALTNLHLRGQKEEYYSLLNILATRICPQHNDQTRSLVYLTEMLYKYKAENKLNEVTYVLEWLIKQHCELGDHDVAEKYVQQLFWMLEDQVARADPRKIKALIDATHVYITTGRLERAADLLNAVLNLEKDRQLPHDKKGTILELLATVYRKKRWFNECNSTLDTLMDVNPSRTPRLNPRHSHPNSPNSTSRQGMRGQSSYWEQRCLNYYHSKMYAEALECVELAIARCSEQSLSTLGRYFYTRGKILQALSASPTLTFPTGLPALDLDPDTKSHIRGPHSHSTVYTCIGDIIQETVATFDKAFDYFSCINDDLAIGKTLSRVAETYLTYLFPSVALLRYPYKEKARFSPYQLSALVAKPKDGAETSTQNKKAAVAAPGCPPSLIKSEGSSIRTQAKQVVDSDSDEEDDEDDDEIGDSDGEDGATDDIIVSFDSIENPAKIALDICADTCSVMLMLTGYMNMAELRYLQDQLTDALAFWRECRDQVLILFMDGPHLLLKQYTPSFLAKLQHLMKRLVRFMLCYDSELINKNLLLFDAYLFLEREIDNVLKRPIHPPFHKFADNDSRSMISTIIGRLTSRGAVEHVFPQFTERGTAAQLIGTIDPVPTVPVIKLSPRSATENSTDQVSVPAEELEAWGCLRCIRSNIIKYGNGKIGQDEMLRKNREMLRKLGRIQHGRRISSTRRKTSTSSPAGGGAGGGGVSGGGAATIRRRGIVGVSKRNVLTMFEENAGQSTIRPGSKGVSFPGMDGGGGVGGIGAFPTGRNMVRTKSTYVRVQERAQSALTSQETYSQGIGSQLMYILQVDELMIFYVPSSGKKRIHKLGGRANDKSATPTERNSILYLTVHLMADVSQTISFAVSTYTTLDTIMRHLFIAPSPREDKGDRGENTRASGGRTVEKKKKKFNSFSKMYTKITTIEYTTAFFPELARWIDFFSQKQPLDYSSSLENGSGSGGVGGDGGQTLGASSSYTQPPPASPPPNTVKRGRSIDATAGVGGTGLNTIGSSSSLAMSQAAAQIGAASGSGGGGGSGGVGGVGGGTITGSMSGHRRARSTSVPHLFSAPHTAISNAWFAKRVPTELRAASQFLPLTERMKGTMSECFTTKEIAESSPQKPLRLYLYFSDPPTSMAEIGPSKSSSSSGIHETVVLSDSIISYLSFLVSPPTTPFSAKDSSSSKENAKSEKREHSGSLTAADIMPNPQVALNELTNSVFASLLEILPSGSRNQELAAIHQSSQKPTPVPSGGFFSHFRRLTSHESLPMPTRPVVIQDPLHLICSSSLQIFPWELLLGTLIVRAFSLHQILQRRKAASRLKEAATLAPTRARSNTPIPTQPGVLIPQTLRYLSLYYLNAATERQVSRREDTERQWVIDCTIFHDLLCCTTSPTNDASHTPLTRRGGGSGIGSRQGPESPPPRLPYGQHVGLWGPLHNPVNNTLKALIKHRKKWAKAPIAFIELTPRHLAAATLSASTSISNAIASEVTARRLQSTSGLTSPSTASSGAISPDSRDNKRFDVLSVASIGLMNHHVPVCIFSYADLVDPHPIILSLIYRKYITLLFVPSGHITLLLDRLFKGADAKTFTRGRQVQQQTNLYHTLLAAIVAFQEEFLVPITIINPPLSTPTS
eukprot:TRINITY_DN1836_c0_g1_i1.p1 TRINITY_DN1836_c0_g1~~TRINITY_DN1836_c0_g1_i1.p1  ORF type:complete len:2622 (-),score=441.85 TRINITY_DN1836_c0_g1_i1:2-7072(-)